MAKRSQASREKIDAARQYICQCLDDAEAAVEDLRASDLRFARKTDAESPKFKRKLASRTMSAFLALQRIEDATRRFEKRLGDNVAKFSKAMSSSKSIRLAGKLANSRKHGLGGQGGNATLLNGLLTVQRDDGWKDESGTERVHVLGMMVTDATDGACQSDKLLKQCIRDWGKILGPVLPEAKLWVEKLAPEPIGPAIKVDAWHNTVVPSGSVVTCELPTELRTALVAEAKRRSDSA